MRLCPKSFSTRLFSSTSSKLETYPRPIEHLRNYITKDDIVHDFGSFKLVRARLEHVPLLIPTLEDFLKSEPTAQGAEGKKALLEFTWPFLFNVTRYPYSYFALNSNDEIISVALQDVVYKDPTKDPRPRIPIELSNPNDPLNLVGAVLGFGEHRHFEILGVDRYLHNECAYTPSILRRQRISSTVYPVVMKLTAEVAAREGLQYSVGIVTGEANLENMAKLNYKFLERIPAEIYKDFEGKPWLPKDEKPAMLITKKISMDLEETSKNGVFEK